MQTLHEISVQYVKGVGPARKKLFTRLGVETVEDLLYFFPRRYEDRRHLTPIARVQVGEVHTVSGKVLTKRSHRSWYTKKHLMEVMIDDGGGRLTCIWFNQPYLANYFKTGERVVCYGKVEVYKDRLQMISPEYEILKGEEGEENLNLNRIVPIYPLTRGMTQRYLRKVIRGCLRKYEQDLPDELPVDLRNKYRLYNIKRSLHFIHFPEKFEDQEEAVRRISFEEFYFFQISVVLRGLSIRQKKGFAHQISDAQALKFINGFSFELTSAQRKVIREIREDLRRESPMLRLLQGDVGSGKTVVALFGCRAAFENGFQSAIMAPTEILARQHFETIKQMVEGGPLKGMKAGLLVSGLAKTERKDLHGQIVRGEMDLVVGTHALLTEEVRFKNLSFVVIDEQHKFGVCQRALLTEKGNNPDVLIMTATPIPRTLCITLYGDLDISVIDEMPKGRGKVRTRWFREEEAPQVYQLVEQQFRKREQAYFVYPLVEESEKVDLKAAEEMVKRFKKNEFKDWRVELVHGQMNRKETDVVMEKFRKKQIDLLVATTVVEVGVDVPSANVMVIEHAQRFGLAQLHQLRGRIGRGEKDALCFLISDPTTEEGKQRLEAILSTTDGFEIAQKDLEIRGPGHFFGRHQHGLNELRVVNPATQIDLLELARKEALAMTEEDPHLSNPEHQNIKHVIEQRYPSYLEMVTAG